MENSAVKAKRRTQRDLLERIDELERQVRELQARPQVVIHNHLAPPASESRVAFDLEPSVIVCGTGQLDTAGQPLLVQ